MAKIEKMVNALAKAKAQLQQLQSSVLVGLPAKCGYESTEAFIRAVRAANGDEVEDRRRSRGKVTDETKALVQKLAGDGETLKAIAAATKLSVPTICKLKRDLGLSRKR